METLTVKDLLARARSQTNHGTTYRLGGGVQVPTAPSCRDERGGSDCSAYSDWTYGIPKVCPFAWMKHVNGGWYDTSGLWWDIEKESSGFFKRCAPKPGAIIVFPPAWITKRHAMYVVNAHVQRTGAVPKLPAIGHVGIITAVHELPGDLGVAQVPEVKSVIHCSSGNYRKYGDAIRETGPEVFNVPGVTYGWCSLVEP